MNRLTLSLVALSLVAAACSYEDLVEYADIAAGSTDLTAPSQAADVRAAGSVTVAEGTESDAQEALERALDPDLGYSTRLRAADEAVALRPRDPKYLYHRAWIQGLAGDYGGQLDDFAAARGVGEQVFSSDESARRMGEAYLDATATVYHAQPPGSEHTDRIRNAYCAALSDYRLTHGDSLAGAGYLDFLADGSIPCGS